MAKYKLLSVDRDAKTKKSINLGYLTGILYLSPAKEADGVHDLCPNRSPQCTDGCLNISGYAEVYPHILEARIAKTLDYLNDFHGFVEDLAEDVESLIGEATNRGLQPAVRANGTSDQPKLARALARRYPDVQFYDYTKLDRPWQRTLPNYHLTYSFSGTNLNQCMKALDHGLNVAVVFRGERPETWHGYPVVDGDKHDLRFLDPKGAIVGLREKGHRIQHIPAGEFVQIGRVA